MENSNKWKLTSDTIEKLRKLPSSQVKVSPSKQLLTKERIITLQKGLAVLGFPLGSSGPMRNGVDGGFGLQTKAALITYQKLHQLGKIGELTDQTLAKLKEDLAIRADLKKLVLQAFHRGVQLSIKPDDGQAFFVNVIYFYAVLDEYQTGVPAAASTVQAILESSYGRSVPVDEESKRYSYNLFGIKGAGSAGSVACLTHEETKGKLIKVVQKFRAYRTYQESIFDHGAFLKRYQRYRKAFQTKKPDVFLWQIAKAGYATDSNYAAKLLKILVYWGLK